MDVAFLPMITLVSAMSIPMGFQADIKNMDMFKRLPFSKWHIAAGQLAGPLLLMIVVQYTCILVFMRWSLDQYVLWLTSVAFSPLLSIVILGIIQLVSLLYPRRPDDGIVKELENIGHILVFMFLMIMAGGAAAAMLLGGGALTWFLTQNIPLTALACWFVMLFASFAGLWLTGWAFGRFDVAKHRI